jgi:hypothetical protein
MINPDSINQRARYSLKLNGTMWNAALNENTSAVLLALVEDIARILGVDDSRIVIDSLIVGSLVVEFDLFRSGEEYVPDATILALLLQGAYSKVQKTYRILTQSNQTISPQTAFLIGVSELGSTTSGKSSCALSCYAGVAGGVAGGIAVAIALVCFVKRCRQRCRRREDKLKEAMIRTGERVASWDLDASTHPAADVSTASSKNNAKAPLPPHGGDETVLTKYIDLYDPGNDRDPGNRDLFNPVFDESSGEERSDDAVVVHVDAHEALDEQDDEDMWEYEHVAIDHHGLWSDAAAQESTAATDSSQPQPSPSIRLPVSRPSTSYELMRAANSRDEHLQLPPGNPVTEAFPAPLRRPGRSDPNNMEIIFEETFVLEGTYDSGEEGSSSGTEDEPSAYEWTYEFASPDGEDDTEAREFIHQSATQRGTDNASSRDFVLPVFGDAQQHEVEVDFL